MLDFFEIPEQCKLNAYIPLNKVFDSEDERLLSAVKSVQWAATLKPQICEVQAVKSETVRYEEIQILFLILENTDNLFDIARAIYKAVKYPCVLIMQYQEKFLMSCCQFTAGKFDYDNNILRGINISHWVHPDLLSDGALALLQATNQAINSKSDLKDIYTKICHAIENFKLSGITKAHVDRLLTDMLGKTSANSRDKIMQYCSPYKKHLPTDNSINTRYDKTKRNSNHVYRYDLEDVWYCLLRYEPTKKIVSGRRYRDIEDLIYSIDTKLEEAKDRW